MVGVLAQRIDFGTDFIEARLADFEHAEDGALRRLEEFDGRRLVPDDVALAEVHRDDEDEERIGHRVEAAAEMRAE